MQVVLNDIERIYAPSFNSGALLLLLLLLLLLMVVAAAAAAAAVMMMTMILQLSGALRPGGPGYILNRAAMRLLMGIMDVSYYCRPADKNHMEDVFIADCLYSIGNYLFSYFVEFCFADCLYSIGDPFHVFCFV